MANCSCLKSSPLLIIILTTLYEDIAMDIFVDYDGEGPQGVFYCTDIPEGCVSPLGEWP